MSAQIDPVAGIEALAAELAEDEMAAAEANESEAVWHRYWKARRDLLGTLVGKPN